MKTIWVNFKEEFFVETKPLESDGPADFIKFREDKPLDKKKIWKQYEAACLGRTEYGHFTAVMAFVEQQLEEGKEET